MDGGGSITDDVCWRGDTKLHRCPVCWSEGDRTDNGFVPADQPLVHAQGCPEAEEE